MTKLAAILDQIDSGRVLPSEFQRVYVWNRDQVRVLMSDLYRGCPLGSLLTWETQADGSVVRLAAATTPTRRALILDNQQRVASLNAHLVTQRIVAYMERLSRLRGVLDRMPEDKITGEDKAVHVTATNFRFLHDMDFQPANAAAFLVRYMRRPRPGPSVTEPRWQDCAAPV